MAKNNCKNKKKMSNQKLKLIFKIPAHFRICKHGLAHFPPLVESRSRPWTLLKDFLKLFVRARRAHAASHGRERARERGVEFPLVMS